MFCEIGLSEEATRTVKGKNSKIISNDSENNLERKPVQNNAL